MNHYIYLNHNLRVITDEKIETSGKVSIFLYCRKYITDENAQEGESA